MRRNAKPGEWNRESGSDVKKFVAIDSCRDAHAAVLRGLDAYHLALTADVDVSGTGDLSWKCDDKINVAADPEFRLGKEKQSAITDVAGLRRKFKRMRIPRQETHWQGHIESASFAAVCSVGHGAPGK
jgi:hypothetical protein